MHIFFAVYVSLAIIVVVIIDAVNNVMNLCGMHTFVSQLLLFHDFELDSCSKKLGKISNNASVSLSWH